MKKYVCSILVLAMICCLFAGCGTTAASSVSSADASAETASAGETASAEAVDETADPKLVTFPIEGDETVTMVTSVESSITPYIDMDHYEQISVLRGWSEATGVTLDVTAVSAEAATEQFNLMAASDSVTDIIIQGGAWYPNGASAGVQDEVFLNLINYTDYMPNYLAVIDQYGFRSNVMTDDMISAFWQINANNMPVAGVVTRGDLLEELGMSNEDIKTFDD